MDVGVVNNLKKIQIILFFKELELLEKGKHYINESFNLSLIIDSADCSNFNILNKYLNYFKDKC